jgi:hypothetical protein
MHPFFVNGYQNPSLPTSLNDHDIVSLATEIATAKDLSVIQCHASSIVRM